MTVHSNIDTASVLTPSKIKLNFEVIKTEVENLQRKVLNAYGDVVGFSAELSDGVDQVPLRLLVRDNVDLPGRQGVTLPAGSTAERNPSPRVSELRFNTDTRLFEYWTGFLWQSLEASVGSFDHLIVSIKTTSVVNILPQDQVIVVKPTVPGLVTVNLPVGTSVSTGKYFKVKDGGDAGTFSVTITTTDASTIDGQLSVVLSFNYESVDVIWTGTNWAII